MIRKIFANQNSVPAFLKMIDVAILQIQAGNADMGIVHKDNAAIYKYLNFNRLSVDLLRPRNGPRSDPWAVLRGVLKAGAACGHPTRLSGQG